MGLEIGQLAVLVKGIGLQVQPGRVDVGRRQLDALREELLPDVGQHDGLAPVAGIDLVPGLHRHSRHIGPVSAGLRKANDLRGAEPLGFTGVQKGLVSGAIVLHRSLLAAAEHVVTVFLRGEKLSFQFRIGRFFHSQ